MGFEKLSDDELKKIITTKGGLQKFLSDPSNASRFFDINHATKRRIADIMKYDLKMDKVSIQKTIDAAAMIRLKEIDVFN